jgi:hypothetical protein
LQDVLPGDYVFCVYRWSVSGTREIERLEYVVRPLHVDEYIEDEKAEYIVNAAALYGTRWLGVTNELDRTIAASYFDECRDRLDERFGSFYQAQGREDRDRLGHMIKSLAAHLEKHKVMARETIQAHRMSGDERRVRMIPAVEGKLKKLQNKIEGRIAELRHKSHGTADKSYVAGGVIRVH